MNDWRVTLQNRVVQEFRVEEGQTVVVGRGTEADVVIDNAAISRRHISLQMLNGTCFVGDLGSTNGTRINGEPVTTPTVVELDDVVSAGKFLFTPVEAKPTKLPPRAGADMDATVCVASRPSPPRAGAARPPRLTVVRGHCDPAGCSTENRPALTVGKGRECDLRVRGWFLVGDPQCRVVGHGDGHQLVHVGGWRATTLNGAPLRGSAPLRRGDEIGVGAVRLRFE